MTTTDNSARIAILGIFVADVAFLAPRLPKIGETIAGSGFAMGPGGKGSNQAVAAAQVLAHARIEPDDTIRVPIDTDKMHLFRKDTGDALSNQAKISGGSTP